MAQKKKKLSQLTNPDLNKKRKDHHNLKNMHGLISPKIEGKPPHFPVFKPVVKCKEYLLPHQISQKGL